MSQRYIEQVLQRFSDQLTLAQHQVMNLSQRAVVLHEAKRVQSTLKALLLQKGLGTRELLLLNTLDHFIGCARLESAAQLKVSCGCLQQALEQREGDLPQEQGFTPVTCAA